MPGASPRRFRLDTLSATWRMDSPRPPARARGVEKGAEPGEDASARWCGPMNRGYACVSQLNAAAGSITGSGGFGYPSGSRVTSASHALASAAAAHRHPEVRPGKGERTSYDVVIHRRDSEDANETFDAFASERCVTRLLEQIENRGHSAILSTRSSSRIRKAASRSSTHQTPA